MIDKPFNEIRQEILRRNKFSWDDVHRPLGDDNPYNPKTILEEINDTVEINIVDIRKNREYTDLEIDTYCLSKEFKDVFKEKTEENVYGLIEKCRYTKKEKIHELFTSPVYHKISLEKKTKDLFGVYMEYIGWNDFTLTDEPTYRERKKSQDGIDNNVVDKIDDVKGGTQAIKKIARDVEKIRQEQSNFYLMFKTGVINYKNRLDYNEATKRLKEIVLREDVTIFSKRFDLIVNSYDLDETLCFQINEYFKVGYFSNYRSLVANALTLSVMKCWSKNKIEFLARLALLNNEIEVFQRATIGITIALISTYDTTKFEKTLNVLEHYHLNKKKRFKAQVYEMISSFRKNNNFVNFKFGDFLIGQKWGIHEDNNGNPDRDVLYGYQFFETPNLNASYYDFSSNVLDNKSKSIISEYFKILRQDIPKTNLVTIESIEYVKNLTIEDFKKYVMEFKKRKNSSRKNRFYKLDRQMMNFQDELRMYDTKNEFKELYLEIIKKSKQEKLMDNLRRFFP